MKISEQHKFIFIHIPKTGGTTITKAIPGKTHRELGFIHWHVDAQYIATNFNQFNSFFKFTFVRNPWDRLYSTYMYHRAYKSIYEKRHNYITNGINNLFEHDFETWLTKKSTWEPWDNQKYYLPQQLQTQLSYLKIDDIVMVDKIFRYEALNKGYQQICKYCNIKRMPLGVEEKSKRISDYHKVYTTKMIDFVYKHHEEDIKHFGYEY